jgi:hypothetical protein
MECSIILLTGYGISAPYIQQLPAYVVLENPIAIVFESLSLFVTCNICPRTLPACRYSR